MSTADLRLVRLALLPLLAFAFACSDGTAPSPTSLDSAGEPQFGASGGGQVNVEVCHRNKSGSFKLIKIGEPGLDAHLAHGDAVPGDPVPDTSGYVFDDACVPVPADPFWVSLADLPTGVAAAGVATDGSKIYVLAGGTATSGSSNLNQIYDPTSNSWSQGAIVAAPGSRAHAMAAALSDGIHLIGGGVSDPVFVFLHQVYDPATDTWSSRPPPPVSMYNTVAEVVDGKIYVPVLGEPDPVDPAMYIYDPGANTWSVGAVTSNTRRGSHTSAVLDGKIYIAGGQGPNIWTLTLLERYDPVANTWETVAPLPDRREGLGSGVIDGHFCVFGGRYAAGLPTGNAFPDTWCYDPSSNSWEDGPDMITPSALVGSVELNNEVYAIGERLGEPLAIAAVEKLVFP